MKLLLVNHTCSVGSTGKICCSIANSYMQDGATVRIAYGRKSRVPERYREITVQIGSTRDVLLHAVLTRLLDRHGLGSKRATAKFLEWADRYDPDVLWLHCIHGYYLNYPMLFEWIKNRPNMDVRWTMHDCWAFTGHCAHFTIACCEKWKSGCGSCVQRRSYPKSMVKDNSKDNFQRKKTAFSGVKNMTLITPSQWLSDLIEQSFLKGYKRIVRYNEIDRRIFHPTASDLREKWDLVEKTVVLGVANVWTPSKGLGDIVRLINTLPENYAMVIVGVTKKQIRAIGHKCGLLKAERPDGNTVIFTREGRNSAGMTYMSEMQKESCVIKADFSALYREITGMSFDAAVPETGVSRLVCVQKTSSGETLAQIYSMADLFVNPTYEDNYPTVNLEAAACGTRVITYDTGGCAETLRNG